MLARTAVTAGLSPPTVAVTSAPAAYWCQVTEKAHLRWVLPEPEDAPPE